jgi:hypothetical protein
MEGHGLRGDQDGVVQVTSAYRVRGGIERLMNKQMTLA